MPSMFNLQRTLSSPNHSHFWGPPSSSVNWCETDYNVTSYVAEYFNTVSSLAMAAVGLLGVLLHPWAERRFHVAFLTTVAVGLGSVAFHGTLHKFAQALDEVPMLYSSLTFVYIGVCQRYRLLPSRRRLFATVLCLHAIVTTLLVTLSHGPLQFALFHTSFGTAHVYALYHAVQVYRSRRARLMAAQHSLTSTQSSNGHIQQQQQQAPRDAILWTFERGAALYGSAMVCWIVDMTLCEYVNPGYESTAVLPINPQLHAWWHVLVSLGLYNMALLTLAARVETRSLRKAQRRARKQAAAQAAAEQASFESGSPGSSVASHSGSDGSPLSDARFGFVRDGGFAGMDEIGLAFWGGLVPYVVVLHNGATGRSSSSATAGYSGNRSDSTTSSDRQQLLKSSSAYPSYLQ